jgi:hypothetical protein
MSQARIEMFRTARAKARARGDSNMVRCMDVELARLGVRDRPVTEAAETEVEVKPRRGRKPKARCEHGTLPERCEICSPEENLSAAAVSGAVT